MEIRLAVKHLIFEAAVSRISGVITEQTISFCCLWKKCFNQILLYFAYEIICLLYAIY